MQVEEVRTLYGWNSDQLTVVEYHTRHFPKGNDVHTTIQRSYNVVLYTKHGVEKTSRSNGDNVDVTA